MIIRSLQSFVGISRFSTSEKGFKASGNLNNSKHVKTRQYVPWMAQDLKFQLSRNLHVSWQTVGAHWIRLHYES